jgi:hypothetical protein
MNIKRYAFPSEAKAEELILMLAQESVLAFNKITVTESTHGVVLLGFENIYEYNEETEENVLIKQATNYDVDVIWKSEPLESWGEFEVTPITPNHNFL